MDWKAFIKDYNNERIVVPKIKGGKLKQNIVNKTTSIKPKGATLLAMLNQK
ncbi:MAG: hypothetical protein QXZ13_01370 [Candidatus Diapherotrites archaeon]